MTTALPILEASANGAAHVWESTGPMLDVATFAPFTAILVYQRRSLGLVPASSRAWRFALGTYVGSVWALWALHLAQGQRSELLLLLLLSTAVGTLIHTQPYFGYAGLVLALTPPLVVVSFVWDEEAESQEALALTRMVQTLLGCGITTAVSLVWHLEAETTLRRRLRASLVGLLPVLEDFLTKASGPKEMALSKPIEHWAERARDARAAHVDEIRSLLEEASWGRSGLHEAERFPFPQSLTAASLSWSAAERKVFRCANDATV